MVAPCVGAWIEIEVKEDFNDTIESLLAWERGLKYTMNYQKFYPTTSLLAWERGLKYR